MRLPRPNFKQMITVFILLTAAYAFTLSSIQDHCTQKFGQADSIYHNGKIITVDESIPIAGVVAVKNGVITKVSKDKLSLLDRISCKSKLIDLNGRPMVPGFVDGHSHFSGSAVSANLGFTIRSPPFGNVTTIAEMVQNARNYIKNTNLPPGQTVYSFGYSDYAVAEKRHPTKFELDAISTVHPVVFDHYSGHITVVNSYALESVEYYDNSTEPEGGVFERYANGSLTGVLKENALSPISDKYQMRLEMLNREQIMKGVDLYFSSGVTTAQAIFFSITQPCVYKNMGETFPIDINGYTYVNKDDLSMFYDIVASYGTSWMKVRGVKFILDGSIQGYTGYLTQPYWVPKAKQYDNLDNYTYDTSRSCQTEKCGQKNFEDMELLKKLFLILHDGDFDILAHTNGDAALDRLLTTVRYVRENSKVKSQTRFIAIHAQTAREDQLDAMAQLGVNPSFFSPHIYFWGDDHFRTFLGPGRANRMNPAKSALDRNIKFTLHNDAPVVLMGESLGGRNNYIEIMEAAINRRTYSGRVLGENQKIQPLEALKAVTINGAWQAREDHIKGSITVGKMADFVVLSDNPLNQNTTDFKKIQIMATVKKGKLVYGNFS